MHEKATRISVTISKSLLKDFDEVAHMVGYGKRSRAVCDAVRRFILENKEFLKGLNGGSCVGVVVYTYKHSVRGLVEKLLKIQHKHSEVVKAVFHAHLNKEECLEVLLVTGNAEKVRKLASKLKTLKTEDVQYLPVKVKEG